MRKMSVCVSKLRRQKQRDVWNVRWRKKGSVLLRSGDGRKSHASSARRRSGRCKSRSGSGKSRSGDGRPTKKRGRMKSEQLFMGFRMKKRETVLGATRYEDSS